VINYDIPHDTESYIHRIGRTGRAGHEGDAILFVAPREKRMLYAIERATKKRIDKFEMPTTEAINDKRIAGFKQRITDTLESDEGLELFADIIEQYRNEQNIPSTEIAAALAKMVQGDKPLLLKDEPQRKPQRDDRNPRFDAPEDKRKSMRKSSRNRYENDATRPDRKPKREHSVTQGGHEPKPERGMERYRLEVGAAHGVKPGNIVGAIANEIGLESEFIGHVKIMDSYSTIDLPEGMPKAIFKELRQVWVCGHKLNASLVDGGSAPPKKPKKRFRGAGSAKRPRRKKSGRARKE